MINLSKQLIEVKRSTAWLLNSCEGNYIEKLYYILGKKSVLRALHKIINNKLWEFIKLMTVFNYKDQNFY